MEQRTDGQGPLLRTPSGEPGVQNVFKNVYKASVCIRNIIVRKNIYNIVDKLTTCKRIKSTLPGKVK